MKYMILSYASQADYDAMAGKPVAEPVAATAVADVRPIADSAGDLGV